MIFLGVFGAECEMYILSVTLLMSLGGCSSDSTTTETPTQLLTGTAATGAPISGDVTVKDITGTEVTIATGTDGSFTLDVTGLSPSYLIKVVPSDGSETLYSYASENDQVVNVTQATNLAMFIAAGKTDLDALYSAWNGQALSPAGVAAAQDTVLANLAIQLTDAGLDTSSFNFFTTPFDADGTGADAVLDNLNITINPATQSITVTDASGNDLAFNETIGFVLGDTGVGGVVELVTVSGHMHSLSGEYTAACYENREEGGSVLEVLQVSGADWRNSSSAYTSADCTGTSTEKYVILGTIGTDDPLQESISGWLDGEGNDITLDVPPSDPTRPATADSGDDAELLLPSNPVVTKFVVVITALGGDALNFGISVGDPIQVWYVIDDTAVTDTDGTNLVMYRDKDGAFASIADPFIK